MAPVGGTQLTRFCLMVSHPLANQFGLVHVAAGRAREKDQKLAKPLED